MFKRWIARLAYLVALLLFFGCGLNHGSPGPAATQCAARAALSVKEMGVPDKSATNLSAFKATVWTTVQADPIHCANCHSSTAPGRTQTPYFADSDPARAFSEILSYVDWNNLASSPVVGHSHDGHCGSSECNSANSAGQAAMLSALKSWASMLGSTGGGTATTGASSNCTAVATPTPAETAGTGPFTLTAQALPSALPVHDPTGKVADSFVPMTWALDALGSAYQGAVFSIRVQQWAAPNGPNPGAYRFTAPRLQLPGGSGAMQIQEIHILVNGTDSPQYTTFYAINAVVTAEAGAPLLSAQTSVPIIEQTASDQISIQIKQLAPVATPSCKDLTDFTTNVLGAAGSKSTMTGSCLSCHGSSGGSGFAAFQMSGTAADLCARTLTRTIKGEAATLAYSSPLLKNPLNGENGHTTVTFDPTLWVQWINKER